MNVDKAWLQLATTPGIGAALAARLRVRFGDARQALAAGDAGWREAGLPAPARRALAGGPNAAFAVAEAWLAEPDHHFLTLESRAYPEVLSQLESPPPWLYALGDTDLLGYPAIAIVGSRNPSHNGNDAAFEFGAALARAGLVVVSGLAQGIDAAAHEGALSVGGLTIAVVGTGLDRVYPARNKALAERIARDGLLVSEFSLGTLPVRGNFPRRNRVIAGLCTATLVVEAARASGSLITARMAAAAGRDVLAMPGSIHNPLARGCHQLIREGAKLVENTEHVFEEIADSMGGYRNTEPADPDESEDQPGDHTGPAGHDESEVLLAALGHDPARIDDLVARTGWTADAVSSTLLILELEGRVKMVAGGAYLRA